MGKHFNANVWREYDSWRTREPEEAELLTAEERETFAIVDEDYARDASDAQDEMGPRFRPAYRVRLMDEM
ncbi:hypothetical protein [Paraburkholderia unamae]|uniref:Uncharacterized protein n=1 Tax=Paraburkholderia unamae TaxID=219649 RepID=A0ABX5K755_9BURK|nr:hypothetical protein [Paraburkholderia unamae]PVX61274.1 hypothetical protein C7402_14267 [Paraburkholderia unamae]